ncbi:hypothetical protein V8C86DRAFT_861543 [Haematococcus lacustris]
MRRVVTDAESRAMAVRREAAGLRSARQQLQASQAAQLEQWQEQVEQVKAAAAKAQQEDEEEMEAVAVAAAAAAAAAATAQVARGGEGKADAEVRVRANASSLVVEARAATEPIQESAKEPAAALQPPTSNGHSARSHGPDPSPAATAPAAHNLGAKELKEQGNKRYSAGDVAGAIASWRAALKAEAVSVANHPTTGVSPDHLHQPNSPSPLEVACHANLAIALLDDGQPQVALTHCERVLAAAPRGSATYAKALHRKGLALRDLDRLQEALKVLKWESGAGARARRQG